MIIRRTLFDLFKKYVIFQWKPTTQAAFQSLKTALAQAPVLALPDFKKTFVIEIDASNSGIGAVLMQSGHPIAYLSKALGPQAQALSTYEKSVWLLFWQLISGNLICIMLLSLSALIIRV